MILSFFFLITQSMASIPDGLKKLHDLAQQQSETVKMADSRSEQAVERKSRAGGTLLPTVTARYNYQEIDPPPGSRSAFTRLNQYSALVNLTQPIYRGAAYPAYSFSKIDLEMQERLREQAGLGLWQTSAQVFYNLWIAQNDLNSVKKLRDYSDERVKELRERVRVGRSRKGELLQAEAQLSSVEADVSRAQYNLQSAQENLDFVTGSPHTPVFGSLPSQIESAAPLGDYLQKSQQRPDLKAKSQEVLMADKQVEIAKAGHQPNVDFTANYYGLRTGILEKSKWDVGVQVSLPLYQGGTVVAQSREMISKKRESVLGFEQLKRQIERDVKILWQNVQTIDHVIADLKKAYSRTEATYNENKKDYRYGLVTSLDVLVSLNDYINTKRSLERAILERELTFIQLKVASGEAP
ncbi:MAG: TolC family protein [Bacteriovoracaceae bacterium]|nr:TolC family protein [Bacteriovoracaceae bacterium]